MSKAGEMEIDPNVVSSTADVALNLGPPVPNVSSQPEEIYGDASGIPAFQAPPQKEPIRELYVKVHIRRSGKDNWTYLGRAHVSQDFVGHTSRVVVRSVASGKIMVTFSENSDIQADKRGNFVVISCVEGANVISWSLNAMNNSETLKLLASIELACYRCRQALADPKNHTKIRKRIERVIKNDRRQRHRRRRDEQAMVEAFEKQQLI